MAHNLEEQNGEVAFALRGAPAWHNLANRIFSEDEEVTTATMLAESKLSNWNVSLEDIKTFTPENYRNVGDNYLVTRTNPFDGGKDVLSVVGSRYKVVQNEELFSFADNILDGGAAWESAGSIKNGRVVFGSLTVDKSIILDPSGANDETKMYLIVWTSHDGSVAVQAAITPVRVVCQNTLNLAMRNAKQSFKIRHTQTVDGRIAAAREALGLTLQYADAFEKEAQELFNISVTDRKFSEIIQAIYPKPKEDASKKALTQWENKVVLLDDLYHNSPTNTNIKGTAWGVVNALTERIDYYRNGDDQNLMASASGFNPITTAEKNKIVEKVLILAK